MSKIIDSYSESNQDYFRLLYNGYYHKVGQSFIGDGRILDSCKFFLKKEAGSPTGNATATIYAHTGTFGVDGLPTGVALATSDNFDVSTLTSSYALTAFNFAGSNRITLVDGTHYFIVIEYSGGDASNKIAIGVDEDPATHDGKAVVEFLGTWYAASCDVCFYVYGDNFKNESKVSTSLTNKSKNSTTLINKTKESTSLTNKAKNSTSLTNKAKNSTTLTNKAKE